MKRQGAASLVAGVFLTGLLPSAFGDEPLSKISHRTTAYSSSVVSKNTEHGSFSADYRYWHSSSGKLLDSATIIVSGEGLLIKQNFAGSSNSMIVNLELGKAWFIDKRRRLSHEIPIESATVDMTNHGSVIGEELSAVSKAGSEVVGSLLNTGASPGYVRFNLCREMHAVYAGRTRWRGKNLQRWNCKRKGEVVKSLLLDDKSGVVLKEMTRRGFIAELTDVRVGRPATNKLQPPAAYRSVTLSEFMKQRPTIKQYELPDKSQN